MLRRLVSIGLVAVSVAVFCAGCAVGENPDSGDEISGKILIWHSWNEAEEVVLTQILDRFTEINRDATVKIQGFDSVDEMLEEFRTSAVSGLGPDLMIAPGSAIRPLAQAEYIRSIGDIFGEEDAQNFMRGALELMEWQEDLYGMPASLNTTVLYYNKNLVDDPPDTLNSLLEETAAGRPVAMSDDFHDTFWGIQAFGGKLFDEDGWLGLDQGGFVNWLAWLKSARDLPGVLLDPDSTVLQERFLDGDAAYYIGDSRDLQSLEERLGDDVLGVATLPSGPIGVAGPLLEVEGLLFSTASSDRQSDLAIELAKFITNPEQSALLMREVQHIPANLGLHINPSVMPRMNNLSIQARNSVPLSNSGDADSILSLVAESYDSVLEGLIDPAQAAAEVTGVVNTLLGRDEFAAAESSCGSIGVIRIANLLPPEQVTAVRERLKDYRQKCPNVVVRDSVMDYDQLSAMLAGSTDVLGYADLILGPQAHVASLADDGHIRKVSNLLTADELQRFQPKALEALRYSSEIDGDGLYGFPLSMDVDALYVNGDLAPDTALNLVDIETQAGAGVPIVLEANLANGFWGFGSMGGLITPENSLNDKNAEALIAWLTWLKDMRDSGEVNLADEHDLARQAFLDEESAYFVGAASEYFSLHSLEASGQLSTGMLPSGPGGEASPIVRAYGIMVNSAASNGQLLLIGDLVRFLTDQETAQKIAETAHVVPANATVDLSTIPHLAAFSQQATVASVLPNTPQLDEVFSSLEGVFTAVLDGGIPPEEAVTALFGALSGEPADSLPTGELDPSDEAAETPENGDD